jgi:hypothetical protein
MPEDHHPAQAERLTDLLVEPSVALGRVLCRVRGWRRAAGAVGIDEMTPERTVEAPCVVAHVRGREPGSTREHQGVSTLTNDLIGRDAATLESDLAHGSSLHHPVSLQRPVPSDER